MLLGMFFIPRFPAESFHGLNNSLFGGEVKNKKVFYLEKFRLSATLHTGMIRVPPGAHVIRDCRLDAIRAILSLEDLVEETEGLKAQVKAAMAAKGAKYAESDFVIARLQAGGSRGYIHPRRLYDLVKQGKISVDQFLSAVSVRTEPLKVILSQLDIEAITQSGQSATPSLVSEFKPGVIFEAGEAVKTLIRALQAA